MRNPYDNPHNLFASIGDQGPARSYQKAQEAATRAKLFREKSEDNKFELEKRASEQAIKMAKEFGRPSGPNPGAGSSVLGGLAQAAGLAADFAKSQNWFRGSGGNNTNLFNTFSNIDTGYKLPTFNFDASKAF